MSEYSDISYLNFHGITDEEFEIILISTSVLICNDEYKTDIFNKDNVYDYIGFKNGDKQILHRDNLILLKPMEQN